MSLIDIILPTYNNGKWLNQTVKSILQQTFPDFSLIIIDDGSTDDSISQIPVDSRIKILKQPHKGLVDSLNHGISISTSKWIARCDGDDILHPKRLEKQITFALDLNYDWVSCQVESFDYPPEKSGYPDYDKWHNSILTHEEMIRKRFIECPMIHPTWLLKRKIFETKGLYRNGNFPEDYEFFLRGHSKFKLGKIPEILLYWRDWPGRISRTHPAFSKEAFRSLKVDYFPLDKNEPFMIWGAGGGGRKLARELLKRNYTLSGFVDIDSKKYGRTVYKKPVIHPEQFLKMACPRPHVINAVMTKGARNLIDQWFNDHGFIEGNDYIHFH